MKQFTGNDGFLRQVIDGEPYILDDVFHYRHTAQREANSYIVPAKVRLVATGGSKGCYGIWIKETVGSAVK